MGAAKPSETARQSNDVGGIHGYGRRRRWGCSIGSHRGHVGEAAAVMRQHCVAGSGVVWRGIRVGIRSSGWRAARLKALVEQPLGCWKIRAKDDRAEAWVALVNPG
ncbi:hypothetical protein E2562_021454 [Oryza meyeriana var. granulata]|uniref:Uncharacterized protein n=1 Tax=Oryza meyeriana var. granulata TaxID=110450 RepID=A0A6G1C7W6_9ORYZ|nr:hypothetical protein E2562_021454 [Oryza meyeriana var. granulata]